MSSLRAWAYGIALAAVLGGLWWLHDIGYAKGYAAHKAEVRESTDALNAELDRAQKKHRDLVRAYMGELARVDALQRELDDAAKDDPDADRPALGADSVHRLNQIR